jgi:hypothetical protein
MYVHETKHIVTSKPWFNYLLAFFLSFLPPEASSSALQISDPPVNTYGEYPSGYINIEQQEQ